MGKKKRKKIEDDKSDRRVTKAPVSDSNLKDWKTWYENNMIWTIELRFAKNVEKVGGMMLYPCIIFHISLMLLCKGTMLGKKRPNWLCPSGSINN